MPKVCECCGYTWAGVETSCPVCGAYLGPGRSRHGRESGDLWESVTGSSIGLAAVFLLLAVGVWAVSGWVVSEVLTGARPAKGEVSSNGIRVGMHLSEVGRLLDRGPAPSPSYPRMRDWFPADEFGDGAIDYEGYGVVLKIEFAGGYVTSVEETPSSAGPGFHRYKMIVRQR
jgi:hypothetical protein